MFTPEEQELICDKLRDHIADLSKRMTSHQEREWFDSHQVWVEGIIGKVCGQKLESEAKQG